MLQTFTGSKFIGFTKEFKCSNCNNISLMEIRQGYVKQYAFFIPAGTSHNELDLCCPVCEKQERLVTSMLWSSQSEKNNLVELLEGGKEFTKEYVNSLSAKSKEEALKRLNKLNAQSIVRFICT